MAQAPTEVPELFTKTLRSRGYSVTAPRFAVFLALRSSDKPLLMRDLVNNVGSTVDRASVYRTVELFIELGIVVRLQKGWKYLLELSDLFTHHHHHLTCVRCGNVTTFEEPTALEGIMQELTAQTGFVAHSHQLEISGLCGHCHLTAIE